MPNVRETAIAKAGAALECSDAALQSDPQGALAARHRRNADAWLRLAELSTPIVVPQGAMLVQANYDGADIEAALPHPELAIGYTATFTPAGEVEA